VYVERVLADARALASRFNPESIPSVYIGGGTPSLLGAERMSGLLAGLRALLPLPDGHAPRRAMYVDISQKDLTQRRQGAEICTGFTNCAQDSASLRLREREFEINLTHIPESSANTEITVEANPESIDEEFLSVCGAGGVGRVSVGIQSFHEPSRAAVHRCGALSAEELEQRLALVACMYPESFSIDLVSGLPLQTEAALLNDIDCALAFNPGHISLYALTLEKGTVLERNVRRNSGPALPDADEADSLWLAGRSRLLDAGYVQYEVSNFSRNGKRGLHNIRYWHMENWLGLGPGASGTIIDDDTGTARRYTVAADLEKWLAGACVQEEFLDRSVLMKETLLMGFRYIEGPDTVLFRRRFGIDIIDAIPETLAHWRESGYMADAGIALNSGGLLLLNRFLVDAFSEIDSHE
jgi:oxygen-independent coproporphyrinogen-3 oxidase